MSGFVVAAVSFAALVQSAPASSGAIATTVARSGLPKDSTQLILGLADNWDSTRVVLQRFEKKNQRWARVGGPVPGRVGPTGLSWGRGILDPDAIASGSSSLRPGKVEGDRTAPAGVFRLGPVFTYDGSWSKKTTLPVVKVGPNDLFVEDPDSELYNTHVRLDHPPTTPWEKRQQMQQGDPAHRLKVLVGHNVDPPAAGKGSAIFLHVWRDGGKTPTVGCTALDHAALRTIVSWLRSDAKPLYVLLPRPVFDDVRESWALPNETTGRR